MRYNPNEIEARWQKYWAENGTFRAEDISDKPKYYVLDMFPYPSGAGLHVGHPLGYIASDIYARYKRHKGFNVLHPQGYDSFGLPAEQYAIQTGQHPAITTETNINRYREQLDKIGFSFDWDREVRTSNPEYYKWTQWIFIQLFNSWYNKDTDKAESICTLIAEFEGNGNAKVNAVSDDNIHVFTADAWNGYSKEEQERILLKYRLTYLAETEVNWCPALGTVLANDEIVNGVSERGGYPVIRKKMTQWSMRISAYAERLLQGLETIDWTESLKESQRNWIGKSVGASVIFNVIPSDLTPKIGLTPNPSPKERGTHAGEVGGEMGYRTADKSIAGKLIQHSKENRKELTKAEALLWEALRNRKLGDKFRRQHAIGKYIADFISIEKRLIIEVDGGYHNDPEQTTLDEERTLELEQKYMFKVLRFSNEEVIDDTDSVVSNIRIALDNRKSYHEISDLAPLSFGEGSGVRPNKDDTLTGSSSEGPGVRSEESAGGRTDHKDGLGIRSFFRDIFSEVGEDVESQYKIEVFTTRPDTIFGVTFMTLAPEHELVAKITTPDQKAAVDAYVEATAKRSERDRMADVKTISGVFTGAYAEHPFTKEPIPIWIGDYVLAGYGTGAVMAVPAGDQRDYDFAKHFGIAIKNIFDDVDISAEAYGSKDNVKLMNSDFLDGLNYKQATKAVIEALEGIQQGRGKTNYRLRDAVFSRQRYWGEPFPVYYVNGLPQMIDKAHLPVHLPEVEKYLPTEDGQPPLGNSREWAWSTAENKVVSNDLIDNVTVFPLELNTMPGWAGSSWYWLRYMDPHNDDEFISDKAEAYWQDVDLYIGGSEHATGHLLYSRFWNKFLKDRGFITKEEPFKKLINQGMILGMSAFIQRVGFVFKYINPKDLIEDTPTSSEYYPAIFVTSGLNSSEIEKQVLKLIWNDRRFDTLRKQLESGKFENTPEIFTNLIHVDISTVNAGNELDTFLFSKWRVDYKDAIFLTDESLIFKVSREVEKMSKSKYNVVTPDDICEQYGADTLRLYEMFLGPLEQAKPWNTAGITGVSGFLKKLWKLYFDDNGLIVTANPGSKEAYKTLHKTIRKTQEDIENFSFNTSVSSFMIAVNELTAMNCHERVILEPLAILISPYAPHIAEELWHRLGHQGSISQVPFPIFNPEYLVESSKEYPVSFNGKTRFTIELPMDMSKEDIEKAILADERTAQQLGGAAPKKVIVVPGRIINIVA
ncbi:leucine--tRNA ligase [Flavobacterium album]|uniref:Leucine--tRNA ligase n=1 Tax=Flavobacterium album TaxID=2175091 RepID=A0A2S1QUY9_9FLAO|nr:class I tRNA ligase family protein [Flavobacterium album]AWH84071.1 leucine--tRNA ligase [Flavobacterium album]